MRVTELGSRFAFRFFDQSHIGDLHFLINRFAHVVNSEKRDRDSGECFHLDAGLRNRARGAGNFRALARGDDVDLHIAQRQGVTKWNQIRRLFRGLNPGEARSRENISFRDSIFRNQIEGLSLEFDFSFRNRGASAHRFAGHIHHLGAAIGSDVRKTFHEKLSTTNGH